ncbi:MULTISPECIES: FAD-dependent oxidoreductase [unclassified Saccharothrix]|uniref:FAD-dependent oxidoreductase n=1 Tax=unclassified Saccharothrix TaxID=2593673 RepID=UPI00307E08C5
MTQGTHDAAASVLDGIREVGASFGPVTITPGDQQYADLVRRELNQRFIGSPEAVRLVGHASQVAPVVQEAVRKGKRLTVISGGHCLEGFVFEPDVQVVLDVSRLDRVYYDHQLNAVAVESGATLMDVYQALYKTWGVIIPAGICNSVGMGGHVAGGGYGMLARQHGLVVDHLFAVEVVVVDAAGRARTVLATRRENDPNRDLWWAHTGGGGGNFGVVTRYLFRSPGAKGNHPSEILPKPPASVYVSAIGLPWSELSRDEFRRLVRNFGAWHVANSAPDSPTNIIGSELALTHVHGGFIGLITQADATAPNALGVLEDYLAAVLDGVDTQPQALTRDIGEHRAMAAFETPRELPWLQATRFIGTENISLNDPTLRADYKSAYMRGNFTDAQIDLFHDFLNRPDLDRGDLSVTLSSYGGRVSAVDPAATAQPHRDARFQLLWMALWGDQSDDDRHIGWLREFYSAVFADTGGVPVPNDVNDGCYINYPDVDLGNPEHNRSAVPWHDLYYKDNYRRLQQVKKRYDPRNVFRHEQSIRLPS